MVDFRINDTRQTGAVENRTYRSPRPVFTGSRQIGIW